jgi:hypothetical protein
MFTDGITPGVAPTQVVIIRNTGMAPLTDWAGGAVPAPFNTSQNCNIPGGVQPGKSCHFYYTFSPLAPGNYSATSMFSTNAGTVSSRCKVRDYLHMIYTSLQSSGNVKGSPDLQTRFANQGSLFQAERVGF